MTNRNIASGVSYLANPDNLAPECYSHSSEVLLQIHFLSISLQPSEIITMARESSSQYFRRAFWICSLS